MLVDYVSQCVTVIYTLRDASGTIWGGEHSVIYWASLPANPTNRDRLLPATYVTTFANLLAAAQADIKTLEGL